MECKVQWIWCFEEEESLGRKGRDSLASGHLQRKMPQEHFVSTSLEKKTKKELTKAELKDCLSSVNIVNSQVWRNLH